MLEFLFSANLTPLIGYSVQVINRYVCDWLNCSMLQKRIGNRNFWHYPELKHKYTLVPLPNLFRQYAIITGEKKLS